MVELEAVTRRYGRSRRTPPALDGVSVHVPRGAVWAVVGPNGAGKSTLLSLILGFVRPTAGRIRIDGEEPREYNRLRGAAYLPERFSVPGAWTVRDTLALFARLDGGDAAAAADRLGLTPHLGRRTGELSRGMLQRVGLAQALTAQRQLVVLDEPTEGLDPLWRIQLRSLLRELRDAGSTIIIASHDLAEVERVADRALLLDGGRVREVIDTRTDGGDASYHITLDAPVPGLLTAFPLARQQHDAGFTTTVSDPQELTDRIAALIALGGVIRAVEPVRQPLEERVRDSLGDRT